LASLRLSRWVELAPYRIARLLASLVRSGSFGLLRLPRVYSYREKNTAGYIDGVFIHTLTGNWVRVRETSPGVFTQRVETPRPLAFGRGILPAPLICADDLAQVTAGTNDNYIRSANAVWVIAHSATTGTLQGVSDVSCATGVRYFSSIYWIYRGGIPFDATGLPDDCDIDTAHVHLLTIPTTGDGDTLHMVGPYAGNDPMVADDYDQIGSFSRGSEVCGPAGGAKIVTLTDFSDISKTAVSWFGVRGAKDLYNVVPTGSNLISYYSADSTTDSNRPKLDVSYTVPPTKTATLKLAVYAQRTKTAALKLAVLAPARALLKVAVYAQPTKTTSAKLAVYAQRTKTAALKLAVLAPARALLKVAVYAQPTATASLRIAVTNLPWTRWAEDLKNATAWTEQPKAATIWTEQLKNTTTWTEQPKVTTTWTPQPKAATAWVEQLKGTTTWAKQPKIATIWTEQPKVATVWAKQPKATTTWIPRSKGTTTWTRRSKGTTTWTRRNPY
jgi:hypothetical protein